MKKILSVLITFVLFTLICSTAFAENSSCSTIIEHFPDGSYLVTTITEQQSSTYVASTRTTKNGSTETKGTAVIVFRARSRIP